MADLNEDLHILGEVIKPGEHKEILMPMPKLYIGSPLFSHVHVINGKKPGPILGLIAALHGDELNGIEIIRKILKIRKIKEINGCLIAIPVANVHGFVYQQRYLMDRRDLNRSFPGTENGSLAARIAQLFYKEIIVKCTHIIDFHTGSLHRSNLPQIRGNIDNKDIRKLAMIFNPPVILNAKTRDGTLRAVANDLKIKLLVYEAGEALRLEQTAIKFGVRGTINIMTHLGMINKDFISSYTTNIPSLICESSAWIRARHSGLFTGIKKLGNSVKANEVLGSIANPMSYHEKYIRTPISGIIFGINNSPLVHEGSALFNIASPEKMTRKQMALLELLDNEEVESLVERGGHGE
ncbi:MAG: succinylglutamate desuccinylase/aspartoacylase family protein [Gammaproteobacteria bacterium]|nr:succinylglutamate desuccinylase/aspartoacylase family protein [Gammaproteobacteria bacterium]